MTRKFKHLPTGKEVTRDSQGNYIFPHLQFVPASIVEAPGSKDFEEIKERKVICQLQGKDLYEGDAAYRAWAKTGEIVEYHIYSSPYTSDKDDPFQDFHSRELAEAYVYANKPVITQAKYEDMLLVAYNVGWNVAYKQQRNREDELEFHNFEDWFKSLPKKDI